MPLSPRRIVVGTLLLLAAAAVGAAMAGNAGPAPQRIAYIGNVGGVQSGAKAPSIFTTTKPWRVVEVMTYHWNDAKGAAPGTIGLRSLTTSKLYGPWRAHGSEGQGGVPNAYWIASVKVDLPAGRYRVVDSDPSSWAQNDESGGRGMFHVMALPLDELAWPPLPSALVSLESVANGCGGGVAGTEARFGDRSKYFNTNNPLAPGFWVNFRKACNLHDAGYSGAKVRDNLHGGASIDFFTWDQKRIDDKFLDDMRLLCDDQIPATAPGAIADCKARGGKVSWGAESRYNFVRGAGSLFYRARPALRDVWSNGASGEDVVAFVVTQTLRNVRATWHTGKGADVVKGEFRGTLISRDQDSIVRGTARLTKGDKVLQRPMSITADPDTPNKIILSGGGLAGPFTRS